MGWSAAIDMRHDDRTGTYQVEVTTRGDSRADAASGAQMIFDAFAAGKETWIREAPVAASDTNFDTKETEHRGTARFVFLDRAGLHHMPDSYIRFVSLGGAS